MLIRRNPALMGGGVAVMGGAGSAYETESTAYFAAMSVAPNDTRKGQLNTLIAALKTAGVWTKLDALYVMAAHDAQAARVNAINPASVALLTGLVTNESQFNNAAWVKASAGVTADAIDAPDGTTTADKVYPTVTAGRLYQNATTTGSSQFSVYVKAGELSAVNIRAPNNGPAAIAYLDLNTGVVSGVNASYGTAGAKSLGNGWYWFYFNLTATVTNISFAPCDAAGSTASTPSGTNGIYVWKAGLTEAIFGPDLGFAGNGTTGYLDTGWNPTTAPSPKFVRNDAHMGLWCNQVNTSANADMGLTNYASLGTNVFGNARAYTQVNGAFQFANTPSAASHFVWSRTASNNADGYRAGAYVSSYSTATTALTNATFLINASNSSTTGTVTAANFSANRLAAAHWGSKLTSTEVTALYSALNTYLTAVGGA